MSKESNLVHINSNDVDCFYKIKPSSIYMMFQEAAMKSVAKIGNDSLDLVKQGVDWIIIRMQVEILKTPSFHDEVNVYTYPGDDMGVFYPRYWYVTDSNGEVIIKASSIWGLLDVKTRKLCLKKDIINKMPPVHMDDELPLPSKMASKEVSLKDKRKIYFSEIDLNGHLNNCSYIKLIQDLHDIEFYSKYEVASIYTAYVKELHIGDEIEMYSNIENDVEYIEARKGEELIFQAEVKYRLK